MIRYTKEYIQALLDKYMDGETTLEEEDILTRYFRGKDIPQEWEDYRLLFQEIDSMRPQSKISGRWIGWCVAAAVMAGILFVTIPKSQTEHQNSESLVAEADTTKILQSGKSQEGIHRDNSRDSVFQQNPGSVPVIQQPTQTKKRSLRKLEPTIHDYDKAYALMAEAEQELQEGERQMEQAHLEIVEAQLAAYGYIPVTQEDGTIIYINEQTNYIAYEE